MHTARGGSGCTQDAPQQEKTQDGIRLRRRERVRVQRVHVRAANDSYTLDAHRRLPVTVPAAFIGIA